MQTYNRTEVRVLQIFTHFLDLEGKDQTANAPSNQQVSVNIKSFQAVILQGERKLYPSLRISVAKMNIDNQQKVMKVVKFMLSSP